jgi:hypothetical protein
MHCPNCGTESSTEQRFCRACGMSLEKVAAVLAELQPAQLDARPGQMRDERLRRLAERAGVTLLVMAGLVFLISICWALITKIIIAKGEVLEGSIFLALILGFSLGGALLSLSSSGRKPAPAPDPQPPTLPPTDPTKQLPDARFEPVPSVTERSTELLTVERNNKPI